MSARFWRKGFGYVRQQRRFCGILPEPGFALFIKLQRQAMSPDRFYILRQLRQPVASQCTRMGPEHDEGDIVRRLAIETCVDQLVCRRFQV